MHEAMSISLNCSKLTSICMTHPVINWMTYTSIPSAASDSIPPVSLTLNTSYLFLSRKRGIFMHSAIRRRSYHRVIYTGPVATAPIIMPPTAPTLLAASRGAINVASSAASVTGNAGPVHAAAINIAPCPKKCTVNLPT